MSVNQPARTLIDDIAEYTLKTGKEIGWFSDPLTPGRGRLYLLQHILRNRLLSSVLRPAWMSRCPDVEVVRKTIGQIRQELVMDDEIGTGHTTILWQMGRNVGLKAVEMNTIKPLPWSRRRIQCLRRKICCRTRHWIVGWLTTSTDEFILSTLPENNFRPQVWKKTFGLNDEQVFFFSYHLKADEEHAGQEVWGPILRHVKNDADRDEISSGLISTLNATKLFYQGICEAGDEYDRTQSKMTTR